VLREVTVKVAPPRALLINRPLGYPLGAPNDAALQTRILLVAFTMLSEPPNSRIDALLD
jgi:D-proline reductase (dithiol) PrdB